SLPSGGGSPIEPCTARARPRTTARSRIGSCRRGSTTVAGSNASPRSPVVLAGSSSAALGAAVAAPLGVSLGDVAIDRFPDGELHVEVREPVRGRSVYVVQSTGAPVGEALLELLLIADACRRAGARRVVALLPYLGLARQDRRQRDGEALGVRVVADVIAAGRF